MLQEIRATCKKKSMKKKITAKIFGIELFQEFSKTFVLPHENLFHCAHPSRLISLSDLNINIRVQKKTFEPDANINAVVFGSRIRRTTALKRFGLYSAFLALWEIFSKFNFVQALIVETTFLKIEKSGTVT